MAVRSAGPRRGRGRRVVRDRHWGFADGGVRPDRPLPPGARAPREAGEVRSVVFDAGPACDASLDRPRDASWTACRVRTARRRAQGRRSCAGRRARVSSWARPGTSRAMTLRAGEQVFSRPDDGTYPPDGTTNLCGSSAFWPEDFPTYPTATLPLGHHRLNRSTKGATSASGRTSAASSAPTASTSCPGAIGRSGLDGVPRERGSGPAPTGTPTTRTGSSPSTRTVTRRPTPGRTPAATAPDVSCRPLDAVGPRCRRGR